MGTFKKKIEKNRLGHFCKLSSKLNNKIRTKIHYEFFEKIVKILKYLQKITSGNNLSPYVFLCVQSQNLRKKGTNSQEGTL